MHTKLTVRVDTELVERAKAYSRRTGKSVSQLIADYFAVIDAPIEDTVESLPPLVRELRGLLAGTTADAEDYHRHIVEKYG